MENETAKNRQSRLAENRKRAKEKRSFNCLTGKNDDVGERTALNDIANITEPSASIEEANDNAFVLELNEVSVSVVESVDKIVNVEGGELTLFGEEAGKKTPQIH